MLKKLVVLLVVGFVVYFLLTSPTGAADAVSEILDGLLTAFPQIGVFVSEVVG